MVGEIFAGMTAFNAMFNAAKTLREIDNAVSRNEIAIDLQGQILTAQEAYSTLLKKVDALEKDVARFETWETEKQRYELKEQGHLKVPAYALKEGVQPAEPPHSICPDCYENAKKSILQTIHKRPGVAKVLICNACGWEAYAEGSWNPEHGKPRRK